VVDFSNRKEAERWFKDQPDEVCIAMAVRSALRVFPLCRSYIYENPSEHSDAFILPVLRALAPPFIASTWPTKGGEIHAIVAAVAKAASLAAANAGTAVIADTSRTDADAGATATSAMNAAAAAGRAATANAHGVFADVSSHAAAAAFADVSAASHARAATIADAAAVESGISAAALSRKPLWPDTIPDKIGSDWAQLSELLQDLDPNWSVWTEWYEDRLRGAADPRSRSLIEELEVRRALTPEEEWEKGSARVNALIADIEAKYRLAPIENDSIDARVEEREIDDGTPDDDEEAGLAMEGAGPGAGEPVPDRMGVVVPSEVDLTSVPPAARAADRRPPSLTASATMWNEFRTRGNPQLVIRVITVPPWENTNAPFDLDAFLEFMGLEDALVTRGHDLVPDVAEGAIKHWLEEAAAALDAGLDARDLHSRVFEDPWVSRNQSPVESLPLSWIIRNADAFLKVSWKAGLGIMIIGTAIVCVNVGWHASAPIGDALGKKLAKWIDQDSTVEDTVRRVEEFAEERSRSDGIDI
tara:strand:- start:1270 stop:2859 length:1590 start_codon:yes stop_codon:yes gene_type:complete